MFILAKEQGCTGKYFSCPYDVLRNTHTLEDLQFELWSYLQHDPSWGWGATIGSTCWGKKKCQLWHHKLKLVEWYCGAPHNHGMLTPLTPNCGTPIFCQVCVANLAEAANGWSWQHWAGSPTLAKGPWLGWPAISCCLRHWAILFAWVMYFPVKKVLTSHLRDKSFNRQNIFN